MPTLEHETVDLTALIKSILDNYPAGSATLREILQNSDDSGANIQEFILDTRSFPADSIQDPVLEYCQGPALIAVNDSFFQAKDWTAIKAINSSSKKTDVQSTGKYGLGFRSCYHITDNPHILSGNKLLILDPHSRVSAFPGGFALVVDGSDAPTAAATDREKCSDHFATFSAVMGPQDKTYEGTAIRFPLRLPEFAPNSRIKTMPTTVSTVRQLFADFIEREAQAILLFLHTVRAIILSEISEDGVKRQLCRVQIGNANGSPFPPGPRNRGATLHERVTISLENHGVSVAKDWIVIHHKEDAALTQQELARRLKLPIGTIAEAMLTDKLVAQVALAFPIIVDRWNGGQLFTLLPLPIRTGFPVHINAVLALTSSRQNLRNAQDVTSQSREELLVEWNRVVFATLVPKAWVRLLEYLVDKIPEIDIFAAWPAEFSVSVDGDSAYWKTLPSQILQNGCRKGVWPTRPSPLSGTPGFRNLSDSLLTSTDDLAPLTVLAGCKVPIIFAPKHVLALVQGDTQFTGNLLNPRTVWPRLKSNNAVVVHLPNSDASLLLNYLAVAQDLDLLFDVPLLPTVGGRRTSLSVNRTYVMASHTEGRIFEVADRNLLSLESISNQVATVLRTSPKINRLQPKDVLRYLRILYPRPNPNITTIRQGLSEDTILRLVEIWNWMATWSGTPDLLELPGFWEHPLLPIRLTIDSFELRQIEKSAIDASLITEDTLLALEPLGVPLLHPGIKVTGSPVRSLFRSPSDIPYLLDSIGRQNNSSTLSPQLRSLLAEFLAHGLRDNDVPLDSTQKGILRSLPIFPVLSSGQREFNDGALGVASGNVIFVDESVRLIPNIPTSTFVDASRATLFMAALGETSKSGEIAILEQVITEAWPSQRQIPGLEDAFTQRILGRINDLSSIIREKIRNLPIVSVGVSQKITPMAAVDPASSIAFLYDEADHVLPRGDFSLDIPGSPLQQLRMYEMMRFVLTREILEERLRQIASTTNTIHDREGKALKLLGLIDDPVHSSLVSQAANALRGLSWLPTKEGWRSPPNCWDTRERDAPLLDLILPSVHKTIASPGLRRLLGWEVVPVAIIVRQLEAVFSPNSPDQVQTPEEQTAKVIRILRELGPRHRTRRIHANELQRIDDVLRGKAWVPISSTLSVKVGEATLERIDLGGRFHQIFPELLVADGLPNLLRRFHVVSRPTPESLCSSLHALSAELKTAATEMLRRDLISQSLLILFEILRTSTDIDLLRSKLLFPTGTQLLVPHESIVYNDNESQEDILLPEQSYAHASVSPEMASSFQFLRASEAEFSRNDDDIGTFDMGEDFCMRISGILKDYDKKYASNEWVANAADAGALEASFMLDEMDFPATRLISSLLGDFNAGPALLVHNDGVFKEADFLRLQNVGEGGKTNLNAIGRFGVGALSYFHFTEMLILVSADRIVFLNPSREYLPPSKGNRRRGVVLTLERCRERYPDHLRPIEGLFGFDKDTTFYNGTIFRLPLRTPDQAQRSKISRSSYSVVDLAEFVTNCYQSSCQSLFFTALDKITALRRDPGGVTTESWSVTGRRPSRAAEQPDTVHLRLRVPSIGRDQEETWKIHQKTVFPQDFPPAIRMIFDDPRHRLSHTSLGIALRLRPPPFVRPQPSKVFATLPLPIKTKLPVHIHASWILSSDRRSVRLEASDAQGGDRDTIGYNEYIISELLPPLYFSALSSLVSTGCEHADSYWPPPKPGPDPIGHLVSKSFYSKLAKTEELLFRTVTDLLVSPQQALLHTHKSESVQRLFEHLKLDDYVALLPFKASDIADWTGLRVDNTREVIGTLRILERELIRLLEETTPPKITMEDVNDLIQIMSGPEFSLSGLPLLQVGDGSFRKFEASSCPKVFGSHQPEITSLFGAAHVTGPGMTPKTLKIIIGKDLNVNFLDSGGLRELLEFCPLHITPGSRRWLKPNEATWLRKLLDFLASVQYQNDVSLSDFKLADLPIIPTDDNLQALSLQAVRQQTVWWRSENDENPVILALDALGVPIINLAAFTTITPAHIFDLQAVLQRITPVRNIIPTFTSSSHWTSIVNWILPELTPRALSRLNGEALVTLGVLPIFEISQTQDGKQYRSIAEIQMLPPTAPPHIVLFLPPTCFYCPSSDPLQNTLRRLCPGAILDPSDIVARLQFPTMIEEAQDLIFKSVLEFACMSATVPAQGILVPDGCRMLRDPSHLFDHRVQPFTNALHGKPDFFVHTTYQYMIHHLLRLGLRSTLDADSLLVCARAVDQDTRRGEDTVDRAQRFWEMFSNSAGIYDLPYASIANLRFVPVRQERHLLAPELCHFAKNLPNVVSPREVCLKEWSSILWTRRATLLGSHTALVTAVYPKLGVPTEVEVVEHLRVLALEAAEVHSGNLILLSDIKKTYAWLSQNSEKAKLFLAQQPNQRIWLNVDEPMHQPWKWASASQLAFELGYDTETHFGARDFLEPHRQLLVATGARELRHAGIAPAALIEPLGHSERVLLKWNQLRINQQLVDIQFVVEGEVIHAHRAFLATAVPHFEDAFTGPFQETVLDIYPLDPEDSAFAVRSFIEWAYTGQFKPPPSHTNAEEARTVLSELLGLLELGNRWEAPQLKLRVEDAIVQFQLIRPETWADILTRAEAYRAERLAQACKDWKRDNDWA